MANGGQMQITPQQAQALAGMLMGGNSNLGMFGQASQAANPIGPLLAHTPAAQYVSNQQPVSAQRMGITPLIGPQQQVPLAANLASGYTPTAIMSPSVNGSSLLPAAPVPPASAAAPVASANTAPALQMNGAAVGDLAGGR